MVQKKSGFSKLFRQQVLRSIRYAKEIPGVDEIVANDLSSQAVEMIKKNVVLNGVESIVTPNQADAM
jgi:tRNA (guanine26-N2/guanine27-N2)-dimethyltransferase